jgi:cation transporter-like permease
VNYPQPYGQGPPPAQYAAAPTNTLAVVSLASGIASYFVIPVIGALVAIITGHMARGQIRRTGEGGSTFALVGLILGYLHFAVVLLVLVVVVIVFVIAGAAWFSTSSSH